MRFSLAVAVTLLASCSVSTYPRVECTSNPECGDLFGLGSVCGDEGYCEVVELHPRCTRTYPDDLTLPVDPTTTYLMGTVFDHQLETHVARFQSAQLAAIQANANDGLEGHDFAFIHCDNAENEAYDDLDKTSASTVTAEWLADSMGVNAIVGPAASSRTEAVYNAVAEQYDTIVVSPSATSPSLTPLDGIESSNAQPGLLWRTAPPDDLQGFAIAEDMRTVFDPAQETAFRTAPSEVVGVVYQTGAYGEGLRAAFQDAFESAGGTVESFAFSDPTGRSDAIALAANGGFDEILFVSSDSADVVAFLQGAAALDTLDETPLFLPDSARNSDVLEEARDAAGDLFPHVRGTAPANPTGAVYDSFQVGYSSEYGGADVSVFSFTAQSFDAAWLVIYGHAWATYQEDQVTGTTIARGFRQVSDGDEVDIRPVDWNLVKASFESGNSIDVFGASGALDYASNGETSAPIDVWVVNAAGDDFDVVSTLSP